MHLRKAILLYYNGRGATEIATGDASSFRYGI